MKWRELTKAAASTAMGLALVACGGHDRNDASAQGNAPPPTAEAAIAKLENAGAIPKLDRSASLAGPDVDGNGVRDDIDAYINGKFTDAKQRKAVLQAARAMQKSVLVDATNKDATKAVSLQIDAALDCVSSVFRQADNLAASSKVSEKIEAITANTKQRLVAYLAYNKSQDGTTSSLARGDTCE